MVNIRDKGKRGEYQFIERFQPFFHTKLERNLEQVRAGGSDIIGTHPFVIEVKNVEDHCDSNKRSWWAQVSAAVLHPDIEIPVVAYRKSRSSWRFLIASELIGIENEYLEVTEEVFLKLVMRTWTSPEV